MTNQDINILKQNQKSFNKDWGDFLESLNCEYIKEDTSIGVGYLIKHYCIKEYSPINNHKKIPHIFIQTCQKYSHYFDHIEIRVDEEKVEITESTSFFGKTKINHNKSIGIKIYYCYPFISINSLSKELSRTHYGYYSHYNYVELGNLPSILSDNSIKSEVDFKTIEYITAFIESKIKEYADKENADKLKVEEHLLNLDKDNDGKIDVIESSDDFKKIILKYQKEIIEIDKTYIHKFIKISKYLNDKKENIYMLFHNIKESNLIIEKVDLLGVLNNQIHSYELTLLHSISMIVSLIESDLITFYEIYESFDKINIFNSNWENEVSEKLTDINYNLGTLIYAMHEMEMKITKEISNLTYITSESFGKLNENINSELKSISSSIKFNNLLTGIQMYQIYRINKN